MDGVLVLIRALNCGPCIAYTPMWSKLRPLISSIEPNIEFVEFVYSNYNDINSCTSTNAPKSVINLDNRFPRIHYFPREEWNNRYTSKKIRGVNVGTLYNPEQILNSIRSALPSIIPQELHLPPALIVEENVENTMKIEKMKIQNKIQDQKMKIQNKIETEDDSDDWTMNIVSITLK